MHNTASLSGRLFSELYGRPGTTVVDIGGQDVNGSLRAFFTGNGMKYICVDMIIHPSVDVVVKPGEPLPFETGSIDIVLSTSCFEHDPCFWLTFKEMTRILKLDGYIYVNAPSSGPYHTYPADSWRFYSDAGQSLAYWASKQFNSEPIYPVKVIESFHIMPCGRDPWIDFVCIWQRTDEVCRDIQRSKNIVINIGTLQSALNKTNMVTSNTLKGL